MPEKEKDYNLSATDLERIISAAVKAATAPNALEAKQLQEAIEKDRRRTLLAVELGRVEEEARWRRQNACTHSVNEKTGESVPKGMGKWITGGQIHGDDSATLICQRCATAWRFMPTRDEREFILNGPGLLGYAPPPIARCINKDDFLMRPPASLLEARQ